MAEEYNSRYLNDPNNINTTVVTIQRLSNEGEQAFAAAYPCILKRIAPAVTAGTALITLPDDVLSIRRLTWLGRKLDPLPQRNLRDVFQNASQQGTPFWYVYNNIGQNLVQLFPSPSVSLGAVTTNLYGSAIATSFIVEYFQAPDSSTAVIPEYFRRRLLKSYVLRGSFNIEGQGQNLKASKYFKQRWDMLKEQYGMLLGDLHNKPRKLYINGVNSASYYPGFPVLPIARYGTAVDAGE